MLLIADFYNWNKVKIRYCDGASFSGDVENELQVCRCFLWPLVLWLDLHIVVLRCICIYAV